MMQHIPNTNPPCPVCSRNHAVSTLLRREHDVPLVEVCGYDGTEVFYERTPEGRLIYHETCFSCGHLERQSELYLNVDYHPFCRQCFEALVLPANEHLTVNADFSKVVVYNNGERMEVSQ